MTKQLESAVDTNIDAKIIKGIAKFATFLGRHLWLRPICAKAESQFLFSTSVYLVFSCWHP